jgi:hypothetical protein
MLPLPHTSSLCDAYFSPTVCVKKYYETEEEARAQQRALESLLDESMNTSTPPYVFIEYCLIS